MLLEGVKNIEERTKKREAEAKEGNDRYEKAKREKRLFHRLSENFN